MMDYSTGTTNSTVSGVAASTSSTLLMAPNPYRIGAFLFNASNKSLFLKLGTSGSVEDYSFEVMPKGFTYLPFFWRGAVSGAWPSGCNGEVRITEFTPP